MFLASHFPFKVLKQPILFITALLGTAIPHHHSYTGAKVENYDESLYFQKF